MSYLVLARKWRPRTFADLVGQEHVTGTLRNAILQGRIAHAFLFTGARGVGKTTIARILAKALNCLERDGASAEPCLQCAACTEIADGRDPDVREIDGASNTGVQNVRDLQETLPYRPVRDRFKVVIVDEVHMISTSAFNAFLKTLEEPPPHVKFIFATTEVHKVIPTVLSRVQRYDFRLLPTQKIRERLGHILTAEGIAHDDAALSLIAREAAGSMRDALSLLDQVIAGVQGELKGVDAARLLGVADRAVLGAFVRALLQGDAPAALHTLETVANEGYDLTNTARNVLSMLRDLVVARVVPDAGNLLDLADEERSEILALAAKSDAADLDRLFLAWSRTAEEVARAREPRWVMEMAAVRLAHRPPLLPMGDLVARLVDLEKRLGGEPPRGAPPRGPSPGGGPRPATTTGGSRLAGPAADPGAPRAGAPEPVVATHANGPVAAIAPQVPPPPVPRPSQPPPPPAFPSRPSRPPPPGPSSRPASLAPPRPSNFPPPRVPTVDTSAAAGVLETWRRVIDAMEGRLVPVLKSAVALVVSPELVRLAVEEKSFYARKLLVPESQPAILDAAERVFGTRPALEIVQGVLPEGTPTLLGQEKAVEAERRRQRTDAVRNDPLVQQVCKELGGEVVKVRLGEDPE